MRYFKVPYDLVTRTDLNETEFRLLMILLQKESEFNKEGKWFDIGYNDIPMHHTTISKYRNSLKEKGLLDFKNGKYVDGKRSNSQYLLKIEKVNTTTTNNQEVNDDNKIINDKEYRKIRCQKRTQQI